MRRNRHPTDLLTERQMREAQRDRLTARKAQSTKPCAAITLYRREKRRRLAKLAEPLARAQAAYDRMMDAEAIRARGGRPPKRAVRKD